MDKLEAAKVMYANNPRLVEKLEVSTWMDVIQDKWRTPGVVNTWKDDAWHGVWWALHALMHDDQKAVECAAAYLELSKRPR